MMEELIVVARVGAPKGIQGQLRLQLFLESSLQDYQFDQWYLKLSHQKAFQSIPNDSFSLSEKGGQAYIQFSSVTDRDESRIYTHAELAVPRALLPALPEGEYYWHDLIGLSVLNLQGEPLGVVESLMSTGANDVLVIRHSISSDPILIPYVLDHIIQSIHLKEKIIQVDWEV